MPETVTLEINVAEVNSQIPISADSIERVSVSVPYSTSGNTQIDFTAVLNQLSMIEIKSTVDVHLSTNAAYPCGQEVKVLTAGTPLLWYRGNGATIGDYFAGDITGLYAKNTAGSVDGTLIIRAAKDLTP